MCSFFAIDQPADVQELVLALTEKRVRESYAEVPDTGRNCLIAIIRHPLPARDVVSCCGP
ncbi:hypothetical protein [Paeniglutamicibacter cryotolerans]|uniref:Uncharacterized protein n=1 Tax=Paeniglutamicibacter cryotolerans TaxID=670079 RepID=A0A839QEP1_9MICC|nr:hypothetical protein [Paeniglutamicibacter cryotolerans]MBB2994073.1 hypothetical protein [Paeniglutamicibacter cryotolerans]